MHVPLDRIVVFALHTMASIVGQSGRCSWCNKRGLCQADHPREWRVQGLWSIGGIGLLCNSCDDHGDPPHARYLRELLGHRIPRTPLETIAAFMYPVYAEVINDPGRRVVDVVGG